LIVYVSEMTYFVGHKTLTQSINQSCLDSASLMITLFACTIH